MHKKINSIIPLLLLLLTFAGSSLAARSDTERERKADAIYMEALARSARGGGDDSYFELLKAAYDLDTTDTYVGQTYGYYLMALGRSDTAMAAEGYRLMRRHFNANPSDYYSAIFYGMINTTLGNNDEAVRVWSIVDSLNPNKPDVAIKLVESLQARRDSASLRRSLTVLDRIERAEGKDVGLTSHKIRAMLALRDTTSSLGELHALLESSPRSIPYLLYAGDVMMAIGMPDSAILLYDRAVAADSTDGLAYYKRGQYYLQRGDSTGYSREVGRALRQENLVVEAKIELLRDYIGKLYGDSTRRADIRDLFESLLVMHPHEPDIRDLYSSYLVVTGDLPAAAEQQEYAVDADVSNAERWRAIISLYSQTDDPDKAIATGLRALEFVGDDAGVNLLVGANYQIKKEDDKAMEYFRKAYSLTDSTNTGLRSQLLSSIGDVFYSSQQPDSAFIYYEKAVELDPDNLLALNNFAYYLAENDRDLDMAERYSSICVRANPDNDTAIDTYAWVYYKKKDYEKAKEWIDRALELEADSPQADVLDHAGDIYFMNRDVAKAVDFWEKALKLDPDNKTIKQKIHRRSPF